MKNKFLIKIENIGILLFIVILHYFSVHLLLLRMAPGFNKVMISDIRLELTDKSASATTNTIYSESKNNKTIYNRESINAHDARNDHVESVSNIIGKSDTKPSKNNGIHNKNIDLNYGAAIQSDDGDKSNIENVLVRSKNLDAGSHSVDVGDELPLSHENNNSRENIEAALDSSAAPLIPISNVTKSSNNIVSEVIGGGGNSSTSAAGQSQSNNNSVNINSEIKGGKNNHPGDAQNKSEQMADYKSINLANPKPSYPKMAIRARMEGEVVLIAEIDEFGYLKKLQLAKSSGYNLLDESAIEAVKKWRFTPARQNGINVASLLRIPVAFDLGVYGR